MGSEAPSSKKEPPWLSILPPIPRIFVSTSPRARLLHRCPVLSPSIPLAAAPATLSLPSRISPQCTDKSCEPSKLHTFSPTPPPPSSAASSGDPGQSCSSPSVGIESRDAAGSSDGASRPCKGDSAWNLSSVGTASEFVSPRNSVECLSANDSHSPGAFPSARIPTPFSPQEVSSGSNGYLGAHKNGVGFAMDGLNEADDPDNCELGRDGCASSYSDYTVSETTSSSGCRDGLAEVDEYEGSRIRLNRENCVEVYPEAESSHLLRSGEVVREEGQRDEGQQLDGRGMEAKHADFGKSSRTCCTSRDVNITDATSKSPPGSYNALEVEDGSKEGGIRMNCPHIGREAEISDSRDEDEFVLNEGDLEEGQLSGEWSGGEESNENSEPAQILEDSAAVSPVVRQVPMIPMTANVASQIFYPVQGQGIQFEQRGGGNNKAKGKKKKKHKKGEGSKKRSREKSKEKHNELLKKRKAERKALDGGSDSGGLVDTKDSYRRGGQFGNNNGAGNSNVVPEKVPKKPTVDEGPEDGEILLESTKTNDGILSSLVEAEVGLWTTDDVDDQFVAEMEQDGTVKRKRGPETAERKLKRKIAKRKKRAQKERELGIRRPPRMVQSKPVKVLCTHYMKGRCSKVTGHRGHAVLGNTLKDILTHLWGDQCTFSHDAVPLTKQEPCKFLMSNSCLKGDDCPYSHDLRAFPCKFFHTRGLCYDGENCQFSHGVISEEALAKLKQRVEKEKKERTSSNSAVDIPSPSFSTPLPPDLDPDPLGWGTPSLYTSHEDQIQNTNPTNFDLSTRLYGDVNLENRHFSSPAKGMPPCQFRGFSTSPDRKDTEFGSVLPHPIGQAAAEDNSTHFSNTKALQSEKLIKSEGESATCAPAAIPKFSMGALRSSSANESGKAEVLEVSRNEETMSQARSLGGEPSATSKESGPQKSLPGLPSMVSPLLARNVVPILRGRQLGSLVLEHEKVLQSNSQTEPKRQHTVDSLLNEALRQ